MSKWKKGITVDLSGIKMITNKYYKQLNPHKFDSLEDQLLENHILGCHSQKKGKTGNLQKAAPPPP